MYISRKTDGKITQTEVGNICFEKCYDVIVCGIGTAGASAAAFAAEKNLSVLGIESFNAVGGTTTIGGISGHYFGISGGKYVEQDKRISEFTDAYAKNAAEGKKLVMERIIAESGAQLMYDARVCGVFLDKNRVVGAEVLSHGTLQRIKCSVLIDCTGDAQVSDMAGCKTVYGRAVDGQVQPYTMVSVNKKDTDVIYTNIDFGRVDPRSAWEVSKAIIFSRAYEMAEERQNGFIAHMPLIGVREGRRIIAEETVTLTDVFAGRLTNQPIFYSYSDLDKHGWDVAFDGETLGDWAIGANLGAYNLVIPVPFKSLIPKGFDGILTACRALGVDRDVASCVRMVIDMKKAAEAAADMAFLAIKHGCALKDIPYDKLRAMLDETGCLSCPYKSPYRIDGFRNADGTRLVPRDVSFISQPERLYEVLASDKPGEAIRSAQLMGGECVPYLKTLLEVKDENTVKHAAFALAAAGNTAGLEVLRKIVRERDFFILKDCRKHNQARLFMAVYWLGRLADDKITDELITLLGLSSVGVCDTSVTRYRVDGFDAMLFHTVTEAVAALIRIGNAYPKRREYIINAFHKSFDDESYVKNITTKPPQSSEGGMTLNIKNVANNAAISWKSGKAAMI